MVAIVAIPSRVPAAVGVKVTLIGQWAPAARELPQALVWLKSRIVAMPVMVSAALPEFVKAPDCAPLVVPTL